MSSPTPTRDSRLGVERDGIREVECACTCIAALQGERFKCPGVLGSNPLDHLHTSRQRYLDFHFYYIRCSGWAYENIQMEPYNVCKRYPYIYFVLRSIYSSVVVFAGNVLRYIPT